MWILAFVLAAAKPVPSALQRLTEDLGALDFKVQKTEPNVAFARHWIARTKLPMPDKIYQVVMKQGTTELHVEHWAYAGPDTAAEAQQKIAATVTSATMLDGPAVIVVSAPAETPLIKAVSDYAKCTKRPPQPSVPSKLKDYKIKDRTLERITESAVLPSGERFAVSKGGCDHVGTSYRFFVEVDKDKAVGRARELLTKLGAATLADALKDSPLDNDVKMGAGGSVRVTYDDRGAEPTLAVEYVESL
jgi:hypothetical protein